MEPPALLLSVPRRSQAAAAAALAHLQGVEKQLQNEGLVFDKGTVQHLEDAIKAIKELEEERRRILELLEEETIKNCNLRVKVKGIPELVMQEFEELVAAARRSQLVKITEIEASVQEMVSAVEETYSKKHLFEEHNVVLCEEQKEFGGKHVETVDLLNQQMARKHSIFSHINELHNMQKDEGEETTWQSNAIEELQKRRAKEASEFEEQQRLLESRTAELRRRVKDRRIMVSQKRMDYEALLAILRALQEQVEEKNQTVAAGKEELAKLFEEIKNLIKKYERKKAEKENILKNRAQLQTNTGNQDVRFHETKEALLQQLAEAEEELESAMLAHKKVKHENNLLKRQHDAQLEEERDYSSRRNQLAKEFERLSNEVTEKLDRLTKRLVEIQNLEEEEEKMRDLLDTAESSYLREISSLELTLQREADRSQLLQDQLEGVLSQYKKVQEAHSDFMLRTKSQTEAGERTLLRTMRQFGPRSLEVRERQNRSPTAALIFRGQNEALEKERARSEEDIRILTNKLRKRSAWFQKFDEKIAAELQTLEDEYNAKLKLLQEKEQKLDIDLPFSEKLHEKLKEKSVAVEDQKGACTELCEEEITLQKSIEYSLKEILRLRRLKNHFRGEISNLRETVNQQLLTFSESLKFLERDNYEANRKIYILNAENARFREGIAYLRAEISTMESVEEAYRSERRQAQEETRALHGKEQMARSR
ncbi:paramyosin-like [Heteronotia binoei]|uniref:paramyosin-like n=1 Tax=Heteronotia binoei TaxID=13085 RepID=UPI00292FB094|nr:paramyosin-like [Heteronotia binoei]